MKKIQLIIVLLPVVTFSSCKRLGNSAEQTWSELPQVTNLDNLKQTDFVPTLENPITDSKNIIYAPAFLYAWNKIKQELKSPVIVNDTNTIDFKLLTRSTSFQNSLNENEYVANIDFANGAIFAYAYFNKTLPFQVTLQRLDEPIVFNKTKVDAFGMKYFDDEVTKSTEILYYKTDDNFILKFIPKDNQHEILLIKGLNNMASLSDAVKNTETLIGLGNKEKKNPKLSWKYEIIPNDIFSIPTIKFNIATNYRNLEGQVFKSNGKKHFFETAYQRTGFILNENGAVVESVAIAVVDSTSSEPIITHPKKMIFDKQFYIIIRRTNKENPYFAMKVDNAELLTKK